MNAIHFPRSTLFHAVSKGHYGGILEIRGEKSEIGDEERIDQLIIIITTIQLRQNAHLDQGYARGD